MHETIRLLIVIVVGLIVIATLSNLVQLSRRPKDEAQVPTTRTIIGLLVLVALLFVAGVL